jgi:hypothetical protein
MIYINSTRVLSCVSSLKKGSSLQSPECIHISAAISKLMTLELAASLGWTLIIMYARHGKRPMSLKNTISD